MRNKAVIYRILLVAILVSVGFQATSFPALAQDRTCQCVVYVVQKLFGKGLANPWNGLYFDNAFQMANDKYWSAEHLKDSGFKNTSGLVRYKVNNPTPQFGDVIIFQPNVTFYVFQGYGWKQTVSDYSSGHIGFVTQAQYINVDYYQSSQQKYVRMTGWAIIMESSNWNYGEHSTKSVGTVTCDVTRSFIFVPNYSPVSFWRVK